MDKFTQIVIIFCLVFITVNMFLTDLFNDPVPVHIVDQQQTTTENYVQETSCQCDPNKLDMIIYKQDTLLSAVAALIQVHIDENNEYIEQNTPKNFTKPNTDVYGWFTPEHQKLLDAIAMVESNGNPDAVGDNGNALGIFQIWEVFWQDATEHDIHIGGSYNDVHDPQYAEKIVLAYWDRYGSRVDYSLEGLARIVNGGPRGFEKVSTEKYWTKVRIEIDLYECDATG